MQESSKYWIGIDKHQPTMMVQPITWQQSCFIFEYLHNDKMSWINWVNNEAVCKYENKFICEKVIS